MIYLMRCNLEVLSMEMYCSSAFSRQEADRDAETHVTAEHDLMIESNQGALKGVDLL